MLFVSYLFLMPWNTVGLRGGAVQERSGDTQGADRIRDANHHGGSRHGHDHVFS